MRDVWALCVKRNKNTTCVSIEPELRIVVSDVVDGFASDCRNVDIGVSGDFTRDNTQTSSEEGFTRNAAMWIFCQNGIEDRVGYLVGHLVWMTFGHAF